MRPAIFIDKDGTLIPDFPYNVDSALITLMPGAGDGLRRLRRQGYRLVLISNQAGVARGLFAEADLAPVWLRLNELLVPFNAPLDGIYYCPHLPDAVVPAYALDCDCRKPKPGLLFRAAADLDLDLRRSWMIGDISADSEAGRRAGCRTIVIEKAYDPLTTLTDDHRPDFVVQHWSAVPPLIESEV